MRLIDADALKLCIPNTSADIFENCRNCKLLDDYTVIELIDNAPTIDAVPVVHGEWIVHNPDNPLTIYGECPFCHEEVGRKWNYCPNCGTKMDGDE